MACLLEHKLAALADECAKDSHCLVPDDYFYGGKEEQRHEIGTLLEQTNP
jgi:hypothetical protein